MRDEIYECRMCGRDLERSELNTYLWCSACRKAWDMGFDAGLAAHPAIVRSNCAAELNSAVDNEVPYKVRF